MPNITDQTIRTAIASVISTALTNLYGTSYVPRIHDHWVLSFKFGESAALLRAISGNSSGEVHSWIIGTSSIKRTRPDLRDGFNVGTLRTSGPNRRDLIKNYRIYACRQFDIGTSADNSENFLMNEIEVVSDAFSVSPTLGITDNNLRGHEELSFEQIDNFKFSENTVTCALGTLPIHLYRNLT